MPGTLTLTPTSVGSLTLTAESPATSLYPSSTTFPGATTFANGGVGITTVTVGSLTLGTP